MISLDGSQGEGGGAILRYALALSTLTGRPFTIMDIRKGRDQPGLKAQHLFCVKALEDLCGAEAAHGGRGSLTLTFHPRPIAKECLHVDIGTAGSTTLLLQSLLLPIIFSKKHVSITLSGGTDVAWSQPADYFKNVFLPFLAPYAEVTAEVARRGFYPKGGGSITLEVTGRYAFGGDQHIPLVALTAKGSLNAVQGIAFASQTLEKAKVADRMKNAALQGLALDCPLQIETTYDDALSDGAGIVLWAAYEHCIGADGLGERNVRAEEVGSRAARSLLDEMNTGAAVDHHLADQIIPYLGVITAMTGKTGTFVTSKITDHLLSNVTVTEAFLDVVFLVAGTRIECRRR